MSCPVVGTIEPNGEVKFNPQKGIISFRVGNAPESGKRVLIPTVDGNDLSGVTACSLVCNADGTRTMTIELELE